MTRLIQFANNATSKLAANLSNVGTSITLTPGDGAKFPTLSGGQVFYGTLVKASGVKEVVKITARTSDTLTIGTRAVEAVAGVQTAFSFIAGDSFELRMTAGSLSSELDRLDAAAFLDVASKSANYTVVEADVCKLVKVDTTSGNITVTLPQISTLVASFEIQICKNTGDANIVTVARTGADIINGLTSYILGAQYQCVWLVADLITNTWSAITSASASNVTVDTFVGDGTAGPFTLSGIPGSKNSTDVFVGGTYQNKATYTLVTNQLTTGGAVGVGVPVECVWSAPLSIGTPSDDTVSDVKVKADAAISGSKLAYLPAGTGAVATTAQAKLRESVSVLDFGAVGDGVADDTAEINLAIATGLNVIFPEPAVAYYITGALTPLARWQTLTGTGYCKILVSTATAYAAITAKLDNIISGLYLEATALNSNGKALNISAGTLAADFASGISVRDCWFYGFTRGVAFDNAFNVVFSNCQFRNGNYGVDMSPIPSDDAAGGYLANITFDSNCRFYANSINHVKISVSGSSKCRGINFFGCDFDPVSGSPATMISATNAALLHFAGCYMEAENAATYVLDTTGSSFITFDNCFVNHTKGFNFVNTEGIKFTGCWSSNPVASLADDAIITDALSIIEIENSTFRSTANSFIAAKSAIVKNSTVRISGTNAFRYEDSYRLGILQNEEGAFTPTYIPATGAFGSITYNTPNTTGRYVRSGNLVTFWGVIRTSAITVGSAAGAVSIGGLPFTSNATYTQRPVVSLSDVGRSGAFTTNNPSSGSVNGGTQTFGLYYRATSNGVEATLDVANLNTGAANNFLMFSGSYLI